MENNLNKIIELKKLTLDELSKSSCVKFSRLNAIATGIAEPRLSDAYKIADALCVTIGCVFPNNENDHIHRIDRTIENLLAYLIPTIGEEKCKRLFDMMRGRE